LSRLFSREDKTNGRRISLTAKQAGMLAKRARRIDGQLHFSRSTKGFGHLLVDEATEAFTDIVVSVVIVRRKR